MYEDEDDLKSLRACPRCLGQKYSAVLLNGDIKVLPALEECPHCHGTGDDPEDKR